MTNKLRILNIRGTGRFTVNDLKGKIIFACNGRKAAELYVNGELDAALAESSRMEKPDLRDRDPELPKPSPYVLREGKIVKRWKGLPPNQEIFYLVHKKKIGTLTRLMRPFIMTVLAKLRTEIHPAIVISVSDKAMLRRVNRKMRRSFKSFDYRSKFTTWLTTITINVFRDQVRKDTPLEHKLDHIHFVNERKRWYRLYWNYKDRIDPKFKGIFLHYYEGMPYKYIANRYKLSINTIKTRIHRVKNRLLSLEHKEFREQKLRYIKKRSGTPIINTIPETLRTKRKDSRYFPRWVKVGRTSAPYKN